MGNEKKEKKRASIVKRMIIAVIAGFVVGFLCLVLREFLNGNGNEKVWNVVDAIFFQDITTTNGLQGLGLFYIAGQLFMRGLQMAIVPLVLTSLSLAMCSLANPERLGKIVAEEIEVYKATKSHIKTTD